MFFTIIHLKIVPFLSDTKFMFLFLCVLVFIQHNDLILDPSIIEKHRRQEQGKWD